MNYGYLFIFWGPSKSRSEALHVAWSNLFFVWICSRVQYYCCCQIWLGTILLATMTTTHLHYKHKTNLMMTTKYSLFSGKRRKEKLGRICRGCGFLAAHSRAIFNQDFLTSFFLTQKKGGRRMYLCALGQYAVVDLTLSLLLLKMTTTEVNQVWIESSHSG